jgi:hypothetical protein
MAKKKNWGSVDDEFVKGELAPDFMPFDAEPEAEPEKAPEAVEPPPAEEESVEIPAKTATRCPCAYHDMLRLITLDLADRIRERAVSPRTKRIAPADAVEAVGIIRDTIRELERTIDGGERYASLFRARIIHPVVMDFKRVADRLEQTAQTGESSEYETDVLEELERGQ